MRKVVVFCSIALLIALVAPATMAVAGHGGGLRIQVANPIAVGNNCNPDTGNGCRFGESMRFLAPTLNVHKGDTLTFDFAGFHTASLLPVGTDFLAFRGSSTGGVDKPYSFLVSDPDDTTAEGATTDKPAVKGNPASVNRTVGGAPAECGTAEAPCDYDGSKVVNSGAPVGPGLDTFAVKVNADPGESFWLICFLHTHMNLRINVVADTATATTQQQVDTAKASMVEFDQEWAEETDARLLKAKASHVTSSGKRVYDVKAGVDSHWANLNAFYPKRLSVPKGATVRYHFNSLVYEDHTVTLPTPNAFSLFSEFFVPGCDPDGDAGAGPDTEPAGDGPPCGGDFSKLEADITSRVAWGTGDGVLSGGSDLENSGIRGAQFANTAYDVKFRAPSDENGWRAICLIHGGSMQNNVVVKAPK